MKELLRKALLPNLTDEDQRRRAFNLNVLLLATLVLIVLAGVIFFVQGFQASSLLTLPYTVGLIAGVFVVAFCYLLSRRGDTLVASLIYFLASEAVTLYFVVTTHAPGTLPVLLFFPVVIAGVALSSGAGLTLAAIHIVMFLLVSIGGANEIENLAGASPNLPPFLDITILIAVLLFVALGLWLTGYSMQLALKRTQNNEARLGDSNRELMVQRATLEKRVMERTAALESRALQLQAAAEVGRVATRIRGLDDLLTMTVHLICERFGVYHAGIFLIDSSGDFAELRASNNRSGQPPQAQAYRIKITEGGLVGDAMIKRKPLIVPDLRETGDMGYKIFLPDTRSEMALPLVVGDNLLGALDVHSVEVAFFNADHLLSLQLLADQVAIAIENARLFSENHSALEASKRAYGDLSRDAWGTLLRARPELGFLCTVQDAINQVQGDWPEEMMTARRDNHVVQIDQKTIAIPIRIRDQVTGAVRLRKPDEAGKWTEKEIDLMQTITDQLSVALESARLYQETIRRAERERMAGEITAHLRSSNDPQTILQTAVQELRQALQASRAQVLISASPFKTDASHNGNDGPHTTPTPNGQDQI
jgi:GAF domain-containing protein